MEGDHNKGKLFSKWRNITSRSSNMNFGTSLSMWWNITKESVLRSFKSSKTLEFEYKAGIDPKSFIYCWDFNHTDVEDYLVIEVEDLTLPMQLDDASLFRESISSESEDASISQWVF